MIVFSSSFTSTTDQTKYSPFYLSLSVRFFSRLENIIGIFPNSNSIQLSIGQFILHSLVHIFIYTTYQYQKNKVSHKGSKKQQTAELSIYAFNSIHVLVMIPFFLPD